MCQALETKLVTAKSPAALLKKTLAGWQSDWETEVDQLMDQRLQRIRMAIEDSDQADALFQGQETDAETAAALCIQLEFLAGLVSPEEFGKARMAYQVDRLARTLADASSRLPVMDELHDIEKRWYSLGPLAPGQLSALQKRMDQGISEIVKQNI